MEYFSKTYTDYDFVFRISVVSFIFVLFFIIIAKLIVSRRNSYYGKLERMTKKLVNKKRDL